MLEAAILIAGLFGLLAGSERCRRYVRYGRHPTLEQYRAQHPQCAVDGRVHCYRCGGQKVRSRALEGVRDPRRTYFCARCGTSLFRFGPDTIAAEPVTSPSHAN